MQISSYKNELWGVNSAHETFTTILDENENVSWALIPGSFIWISVGPTETWAIHPNKSITSCTNPCTGEWKSIYGNLDKLSVGNEEVWGVNFHGSIYKSPVPYGAWTLMYGKKMQQSSQWENTIFMECQIQMLPSHVRILAMEIGKLCLDLWFKSVPT